MCSHAHLLTYANQCCTPEHFVSEALLCWVLVTAASLCSQLVPEHTQPSQNRLCHHPTNPGQDIAMGARPGPSTAAVGAAGLSLGYTDRRRQQGHHCPRACRDAVPNQGTHQLCPAAPWNWNSLCLHWQLHLRVKSKLILKLWDLLTSWVFFEFVVLNSGPQSSANKCCCG